MNAAARLGLRHTLHPVHAGFEFQPREHAAPGNRRNDFLVAAGFAVARRKHLDAPAFGGRITLVHAKEITGKERRFRSAGAGADFEDRTLLVGRILRQKQDLDFLLQRLDRRFDLGLFHFGEITHLPVGRLVGEHGGDVGKLGRRLLIGADLRHDRLQLGILRGKLDINVRSRAGRHAGLDLTEPPFQFAHLFNGKLCQVSLQMRLPSPGSGPDEGHDASYQSKPECRFPRRNPPASGE